MSKEKCQPVLSGCSTLTTDSKGGVTTPAEPTCPAVGFCLPFGGSVHFDGSCLSVENGTPPADGIYGRIQVEGGCIVGALPDEVPVYTAWPCAPVPTPCDCEGSGSGSSIQPSPQQGNLFALDSAGRGLVTLNVVGVDGIGVEGDGSAENPLVVYNDSSNSAGSRPVFSVDNPALYVQDTGAEVSYGHRLSIAGTVDTGSFRFDEFGHLIGYTQQSTTGTINGIVQGDGIKVDVDQSVGVATISLADVVDSKAGVYQLGAYDVTIDKKNRITRIDRTVDAPAGEYTIGDAKLTIDDSGLVTGVELIQTSGLITTAASKVFRQGFAELTREMTIQTARDAAFRISYRTKAAMPADVAVYVDGVPYTGDLLTSTQYEVLTPAIFAAGTHTITIRTDAESGLTGVAYLDVLLTLAV